MMHLSQHKPEPGQALVDITEREKRLLAQQLHEGLLQTLSAASILSRVVAKRAKIAPHVPMPELVQLQETIDSAIDEARFLIRLLQRPGLDKASVLAALQDIVVWASPRWFCEFSLKTSTLGQFRLNTATALVRIAQEAVHAALQRPHVSRIAIKFSAAANLLRLTVQADGRRRARMQKDEQHSKQAMASYASLAGGEVKTVYTREGITVTFVCSA